MENTLQELREKINKMQDVHDKASTPAEQKVIIAKALINARKTLADLEEAEKNVKQAEAKQEDAQEAANEVKENIDQQKSTPTAKTKKTVSSVVEKARKAALKTKQAKKELIPVKKAAASSIKNLRNLIQSKSLLKKVYDGVSESDLKRDAGRKAKSPGKRKAADGSVYYEHRANRVDVTHPKKAPFLAKGGKLTTPRPLTEIKKVSGWDDAKLKNIYQIAKLTGSRFVGEASSGGGVLHLFLWAPDNRAIVFFNDDDYISSSNKIYLNPGKIQDDFFNKTHLFNKYFDTQENFADVKEISEVIKNRKFKKLYAGGGSVKEENDDIWLSVEGDPVSWEEFVEINKDSLTDNEFEQIKKLKVGETWKHGFGADVTRVPEPDEEDMIPFLPSGMGRMIKNVTVLTISNDNPLSTQLRKLTGDTWNDSDFRNFGPGAKEKTLTTALPFEHIKSGHKFMVKPKFEKGGKLPSERISESVIQKAINEDDFNKAISMLQNAIKPGYPGDSAGIYFSEYDMDEHGNIEEWNDKSKRAEIIKGYIKHEDDTWDEEYAMDEAGYAIFYINKKRAYAVVVESKDQANLVFDALIDYMNKNISQKTLLETIEKYESDSVNLDKDTVNQNVEELVNMLFQSQYIGENIPVLYAVDIDKKTFAKSDDYANGGQTSGTIWLSVNGEAPVTWDQFYKENTAEDVEPLTEEEFDQIKNLKVGEKWEAGGASGSDIIRVSGPENWEEEIQPERELLIDESRGIYIPQHFYDTFDFAKFNLKKEDYTDLSSPENEFYWEAWDELLSAARTDDGDTLDQDGDLWLIKASKSQFKGGGTTAADLKRKLQKGQAVKMVKWYGHTAENVPNERIKSILGLPRYIVKVQTNGIYLSPDKDAKTGSWLEFPPASLMEITANGFKTFEPGIRELNEKEKEVIANAPKDDRQEYLDAISDGSTMYWRKKTYYDKSGYGYLYNSGWERGMHYDMNEKKVMDKSIKGKEALEYEFVDDKFKTGGQTNPEQILSDGDDLKSGGELKYKDGSPVRFVIIGDGKGGYQVAHRNNKKPYPSHVLNYYIGKSNRFDTPQQAQEAIKDLAIQLNKELPEHNPALASSFGRKLMGFGIFKEGGNVTDGEGRNCVFQAETSGGKWGIRVFKYPDKFNDGKVYQIEQFKNDRSTGLAGNYSRNQVQLYLNYTIDGSAKIDGHNYKVISNPENLTILKVDKSEPLLTKKMIVSRLEIPEESFMKQGGELNSDMIDTVLRHYIAAALWSSNDNDTEKSLDSNYSISDISEATMAQMERDVRKFLAENAEAIKESGLSDDEVGHDFWLTRNHHGTGFWDREIEKGVGDQLTKSAHAFGEIDLEVGDDGKIHSMTENSKEDGGSLMPDVYDGVQMDTVYSEKGGTINTKDEFYKSAMTYLKQAYGLDPSDMEMSEENHESSDDAFDNGETPEEFIDGYAEKYGLTKKSFAEGGNTKVALVPAVFTTDDEHEYPGFYDPAEDWNGFACPAFRKEVALEILKNTNIPFEWRGEELFADLSESGEGPSDYEECGPVQYEIDGKQTELYPVGAYFWIWTVVEKPKKVTKQNKSEKKLPSVSVMKQRILDYVAKFPVNAKTWDQATDELPHLHSEMNDIYQRDKGEYNFDFEKRSQTPSERNTRHTKGVKKLLTLMSDEEISTVYKNFRNWFESNYAGGGQLKFKDGTPVTQFSVVNDAGDWRIMKNEGINPASYLSESDAQYWIGTSNKFTTQSNGIKALKKMLRAMYKEQPAYNREFKDGGGIDVYDDMKQKFPSVNKRINEVKKALIEEGYTIQKTHEPDFDTDGSIDLTNKISIGISMDLAIDIVIVNGDQDNTITFLPCGKSINLMKVKLKKILKPMKQQKKTSVGAARKAMKKITKKGS